MSKTTNPIHEGRIGTGSGLINPNSKDFHVLREAIREHSSLIPIEDKVSFHIKGLQYRMESYLSEEAPKELIPVGAFLKELIEIIGVSHSDFAKYIGYKSSNLSALYAGQRKINHDIALKVGHIFDIPPTLWLNIQNKLELLQIEKESAQHYQQYHLSDLLKKVS